MCRIKNPMYSILLSIHIKKALYVTVKYDIVKLKINKVFEFYNITYKSK